MLKESVFYEFLNRREGMNFREYLQVSKEGEDYIDWNQFVLPNDYGDAELEYNAIRHSCALCDVSPMRKYRIRGEAAGYFLDHLLTRPVSDALPMQGIYVAFCNEDGSLKDDSILYKHAEDDYLLMPSDIDHCAYFESLRLKLGIAELSIVDCTTSLAGMAIQGPKSATVMKQMGFIDIEMLEPFKVKEYHLKGDETNSVLRVARMGFTGDLGYECWMEAGLSKVFEQTITSARSELGIPIPGYGLTALEACRLECGFIVAGWDCATEADPQPGFERSPFELDIGWLVDLNATDFVGKSSLVKEKQEGSRYVKRSFKLDNKKQPDSGADIWTEIEGKTIRIGSVNCSSWSWSLQCTIGNASIFSEYMNVTSTKIDVNGQRQIAELSRGALLKLERQKQVPAIVV